VFSVAIGYNGAPASAKDIAPLRFADDDAASFHGFARGVARRSFLLTVFDPESLRRFPTHAAEARPPSRAELTRVWDDLKGELIKATAAGDETVVLVFYSGHGIQDPTGAGLLTLLEGSLDQTALYEELLAPLPARFVHLFVDACHAEAIVRPRDLQAKVVDTTDATAAAYLNRTTLARFPHVGAVVASTAGAQAHEWDAYQAGVFTHEILSALRGAADVDGNRRVEYSELAAFLAAANREVSDPRARPHTVIRAPQLNPRVPIVDLGELRDAALLEGKPGDLGAFHVEDERGVRILDLRAEEGFRVTIALPARETLYLRSSRGEVNLRPEPGSRLRFEDLRWAPADVRARGALESALRRGLFAARFGPNYYRGFADNTTELVAVDIREAEAVVEAGPPAASWQRRAAWPSLGLSAGLAVVSGAFGAFAWRAHDDFQNTDLERPALEAQNRYERNLTVSLTALVAAALVGGLAAYLFAHDRR
jgi:hypothetical protein